MIKKNFMLTGPPGVGKTTLIKEVLKEGKFRAGGFYTEEVRQKGRRVGFRIVTLDGKEGMLAWVGVKSPYKVGRYGVVLRDLEEIAVPSMKKEGVEIVIIDEIGKMECFSSRFRESLVEVLESEVPVLATIKERGDRFIEGIKARKDVELFLLTRSNWEKVKEDILNSIKYLQG